MSLNRDLPAVDDATRELCHYRHMWDRVDSLHWWGNSMQSGEPLTLRCMRCLTEFRAQIGSRGQYVTKRYVYPPGYQYAKDEHKLTHAERRMLLAAQVLADLRKPRPTRRRRSA